MPDIKFDIGEHCFNFRVAAVIEQDEHFLINQQSQEFWFLPGGRVGSGETTEDALLREMREELNIDVKIIRTLFITESFFDLEKKSFQELCFYYLIQPSVRFKSLDSFRVETDGGIDFRFVAKDDLNNYDLRPSFLIEKLKQLPKTIEHIVLN